MKYVELYKSFKSDNLIKERSYSTVEFHIRETCRYYSIGGYTINKDGSIDVDGSINLQKHEFSKLPLKFRNVNGDFYCSDNKLITLEGCPKKVGGSFGCCNNKLITLEGCPETVGDSFNCYNNKLTSLKGCPEIVNGHFRCFNNQLTSLNGCPKNVGGNFACYDNQIISLEGPKKVYGDFRCYNNEIISFEGFPNIYGCFYCGNNPIWNIVNLITKRNHENSWYSKIELFNDMDIIQDGVVILDRLNYFLEEIGKPTVKLVNGYKYI